jgi:predicted phage terminase large subunit-like protein
MNKAMTNKEFEKKIQSLIEDITRETTIFPNDNKTLQRIRREKALNDIFFFAETYFPHYIKAKFGKPHKKMHRYTETNGCITAIAGFRGLGKTTFLSIIKPIWKALKGDCHFNAKIAKSVELAKERTEAIRIEFLHNKRLINDFGNQLAFSQGEETDFSIKKGCRFLALGYKSGIRGKLFGSFRPDYIDIDDLEDHQTYNEKIAQDKLKYVCEEAYGALYKGQGTLVWLGNLTHQKSALNLFKIKTEEENNPQHNFLLISADDGDFNPTWPENFSSHELKRICNAMGSIGYERHMRMNPIIEGVKFKARWFKYGLIPGQKEKIVTFCDPSLGEKSTSDYKAIITVGYSKQKYNLLDCFIRKTSIPIMIEYLYYIDASFDTTIYMESNFWQKVIWEFIPEIAKNKGYPLPVLAVENKINKSQRIEKLQPLFEWGWILFPAQKTKDLLILEDQLLGFPNYPADDGPDALAGAVSKIKESLNQGYNNYASLEKKQSPLLKQLF